MRSVHRPMEEDRDDDCDRDGARSMKIAIIQDVHVSPDER